MILAHVPASTLPPPHHTHTLISPLYISLPFTFCWAEPYIPPWLTKTQGPGRVVEPWDWSMGEWVPSHLNGLHKLFFGENKGGKCDHFIIWLFVDVPNTLLHNNVPQMHTVFSSVIFSDGWANIWRNMTPCLFPHALQWLRNMSSHLGRDCYHIQIFPNPMELLRIILLCRHFEYKIRCFKKAWCACLVPVGLVNFPPSIYKVLKLLRVDTNKDKRTNRINRLFLVCYKTNVLRILWEPEQLGTWNPSLCSWFWS